MKVISDKQIENTEFDVNFTGGHSLRMAKADEGLGFSVNKTIIPKSETPHLWQYKHHREVCYCIEGYGIAKNGSGDEYAIHPGVMYIVYPGDPVEFLPVEDTVLISIFNPPLTGKETHDAEGSYGVDQKNVITSLARQLADELSKVTDISESIELLNHVRKEIGAVSPMKHHPVDCIIWEKSEDIEVQRINPNSIPPPEMELLYQSILNDGYTMPVVSWRQPDGSVRVVDGFHRRKIERMHKDISDSTYGHIPVSFVRSSQSDESDRMASTIRHNRARGVHNIELMSTIVAELVEMGKGDRWICQHIGMSPDELLRLKQITGLASLFANKSFSMAWEPGEDELENLIEDHE